MPAVAEQLLNSTRDALSTASLAASSVLLVAASTAVHATHTKPDVPLPPKGLATLNSADIVMILLTISVILQVLNFHYFKIPPPVFMAFGAILMTVFLLILSQFPWLGVSGPIEAFRSLLKDFPDLLLNYMLGFLLFAAAIEVDLRNLGRILTTVLALSIVSTLLSTLIVGVLTYFLMQNIAHMDFVWCLLFGAIVSPTDPVTVISILNEKPDLLPASTRYFVIGESLLNDAVGVVLYLVLIDIVEKPDLGGLAIAELMFETVFVECVYGLAVGIFLAWLAYSLIGSVEEPLLEVVISFVLVGNINMICRILHASIPLASVGAGLFIGNYAVTFSMIDETKKTFHAMWKLADETLNSILFLMIGSAVLFWNPQDLGWGRVLTLVVCTISISMVARFLAVALPLLTIIFIEWVTGQRLRHASVRYRGGTIAVLTWAGMRGGISIALALGVPDSFVKHAVPGHMTYGQLIFFMTFILVVFSIIVQGMLFEPVVKMINRVSFQIFPNGGLGTYVSSNSFANTGEFYDHEDDESPEDSIIPGSEDDNFLKDFLDRNPPTEHTACLPRFVDSENDEADDTHLRRRASDFGVRRETVYGSAMHPHVAVHTDHERQGSITFQNLPNLEQPPSIPAFFGDLRRRGTTSFRQLLGTRADLSVDDGDNNRLRRSRTEPDNARLARGGDKSDIR